MKEGTKRRMVKRHPKKSSLLKGLLTMAQQWTAIKHSAQPNIAIIFTKFKKEKK